MKFLFRLYGLGLLFALAPAAWAQFGPVKVARIEIKFVGPPAVSEQLIRANIRVKVGDAYPTPLPLRTAEDDDVRNLYATGFFHNIHVGEENTPEGMVITYVVQGKPRVTEIRFHGNVKYSDSKLRKKISSKAAEPLDERKLFTDSQDIEKMYQKSGYPHTTVKAVPAIDEGLGVGTVTFEIKESFKVKIVLVEFVGATAFPQSKLRKQVKTRKHWMFSWITGHGFLKDEDFEEDKEKLVDYYRDHGYLDFEIKDVQFVNPTPKTMVVKFIVYEGTQYKVGSIKFTGNKLFSTPEIIAGMRKLHGLKHTKGKIGANGFEMDIGDPFTPKGLAKDTEMVEDFYGGRGYIDVTSSSRNLTVVRIANTETGTMDLEFRIDEGQKSYIERIDIRGNTKTKDKVIRRELAVSPGELFDMVRVKVSKQRLEGLQYFEKVDTRPEPTDAPNRKNLVIGVDEKKTGNLTLGAGFSSVDSVVGYVELTQGNFDLFNLPTFTGGGQKFRLRVQIGTERQDYTASFIEPWFLGRKLALGVDLYYRELDYQSLNDLYYEYRAGAKVGLTRALGSDKLIGNISYTLEEARIKLTDNASSNAVPVTITDAAAEGWSLLSRAKASLAYDTRGGGLLPNKGQRTELSGEVVGGPLGGDKSFYKIELHTGWYFPGFFKGHVLEIVGSAGVAHAFNGDSDVPFYERYYLGGLYSMRGFKYRSVSPREAGSLSDEPIGGDTYWFTSAEYSIPIIERLRIAFFYDMGDVQLKPGHFDFSSYDSNYGVGLRLNLPIGPLRLDYGIPIKTDQYNGSSGRFQFGVGYTREF
jgi:outer membrane protein insertion porin family